MLDSLPADGRLPLSASCGQQSLGRYASRIPHLTRTPPIVRRSIMTAVLPVRRVVIAAAAHPFGYPD